VITRRQAAFLPVRGKGKLRHRVMISIGARIASHDGSLRARRPLGDQHKPDDIK
jgi:hypothetical protein